MSDDAVDNVVDLFKARQRAAWAVMVSSAVDNVTVGPGGNKLTSADTALIREIAKFKEKV